MRAPQTKTMLSMLSLLATALLLTVGLSGSPASGAPGATIGDPVLDGCIVSVPFTVEDAGTYFLVVYDDGVIVGSSSVELPAGGSASLTHTIVAAAGASANGIGLYIADTATASVIFDAVDPYTYPDDLADTCTGEPTTTTTTTFPIGIPVTTRGPGYVGTSTTTSTAPTETTVPTTATTEPTTDTTVITTEPPVETTAPAATAPAATEPAATVPASVAPGSMASNGPGAVGGASAARPVSGAADYTG